MVVLEKIYSWHLNISDFILIEKLQRFCKEIWDDINFKIFDIRESSKIYRISSNKKKLALEFDKLYTKDKEKRIPCDILNETIQNKKWYLIVFYSADGNQKNKQKNISFSQKYKITISSLNYLCHTLGLKTCNSMRHDKFNIFQMITVKNQSDEKVGKIKNLGKKNDYVYDIETETHDSNCGFPLIVHNTDSFILNVNTKDVIKDLKSLEDIFDFSNLDRNHELFSYKNKKVLGIFKIETSKKIWIGEFIALRKKMYAYRCGDDNKNKFKGVSKSQSKNIKFEGYKKCLDGGKYQRECNNYIIRSIIHEMYLQEVKKIYTIFIRWKRCYIKNIETKPWN